MKILVQRVTEASVEVAGKVVGQIETGVVVFVGIKNGDTAAEGAWLANKLIHLRLFKDEAGKINRSLLENKGSVLIVSQFTLYGDCRQGRRPSFTEAAPPEVAHPLYEQFIGQVRQGGVPVATGVFGAKMKVCLVNDGPITLIIER